LSPPTAAPSCASHVVWTNDRVRQRTPSAGPGQRTVRLGPWQHTPAGGFRRHTRRDRAPAAASGCWLTDHPLRAIQQRLAERVGLTHARVLQVSLHGGWSSYGFGAVWWSEAVGGGASARHHHAPRAGPANNSGLFGEGGPSAGQHESVEHRRARQEPQPPRQWDVNGGQQPPGGNCTLPRFAGSQWRIVRRELLTLR